MHRRKVQHHACRKTGTAQQSKRKKEHEAEAYEAVKARQCCHIRLAARIKVAQRRINARGALQRSNKRDTRLNSALEAIAHAGSRRVASIAYDCDCRSLLRGRELVGHEIGAARVAKGRCLYATRDRLHPGCRQHFAEQALDRLHRDRSVSALVTRALLRLGLS